MLPWVRAPLVPALDPSGDPATLSQPILTMESLTRVLFGEVEPQGLLPVMIPTAVNTQAELYPFGYGLSFDDWMASSMASRTSSGEASVGSLKCALSPST